MFFSSYADIQKIKKKLSLLNKQRTEYVFSLVHAKPMVHGLPHMVYRKCGKKRCKCYKGHPHGPYMALSINKNGKQKIVTLKKADAGHLHKKAKRYKHFQETLAKIRKINREMDHLLNTIKIETTSKYPAP